MKRSTATAERSVASRLSLLIVDDDVPFSESLRSALRAQGFEATAVDSCVGARAAMAAHRFDAILVDRKLPDGDGVELLRGRPPRVDAEFIVITGYATVPSAVDALKKGAHDYLTKPLDFAKLNRMLAHLTRTRAQHGDARAELVSGDRFGAFIGRSDAMRPVFEQIARVAPTDASVLIEGESGTGKELVAEAIHHLSGRRAAPLVPVNCGAVAESLIESELFGHERGSFTGAERMHRGFFERANGGTLFLDEITEMSAPMQVRLLRVIESGRIQRIGSAEQIPVDVRVLAATNRRSQDAIREGRLREDLFFRLAVFPIFVPPLRDRAGDVALLAAHFLALLNDVHDTRKRWAADAVPELEKRDWKGNVRELKNAVHRAYIMADDVLHAESAIEAATGNPRNETALAGPRRDVTSVSDTVRNLIFATLEDTHGDKRAAAGLLGISLKTLYNRLNVYNASRT